MTFRKIIGLGSMKRPESEHSLCHFILLGEPSNVPLKWSYFCSFKAVLTVNGGNEEKDTCSVSLCVLSLLSSTASHMLYPTFGFYVIHLHKVVLNFT